MGEIRMASDLHESDSKVEEVQAVVAEPDKVNLPGRPRQSMQVQARKYQVRSKLAQQLFGLIEPDLSAFYKAVRDPALGVKDSLPKNKDGKLARSAGRIKMSAQQLYLSLIKIASANVDVNTEDVKGDVDMFLQQLKTRPTEELGELLAMAKKMEDGDDDGSDSD